MHNKLLSVFLLLTLQLSAQTARIDSLKQVLISLNNRGKVDCLNALASEYEFNFIRADSSLKYSELAYQYASAIRYTSGQAVALMSQGDVHGRLLGKTETMAHNSKLAIEMLDKENDPVNLSLAHYKL